MSYGWNGIRVRHDDGRRGVIREYGVVVGWLTLEIQCDDGTVDVVVLSAIGRDSGTTGWYFLSDDNGREPMWIQLGDHWTPEVTTP